MSTQFMWTIALVILFLLIAIPVGFFILLNLIQSLGEVVAGGREVRDANDKLLAIQISILQCGSHDNWNGGLGHRCELPRRHEGAHLYTSENGSTTEWVEEGR